MAITYSWTFLVSITTVRGFFGFSLLYFSVAKRYTPVDFDASVAAKRSASVDGVAMVGGWLLLQVLLHLTVTAHRQAGCAGWHLSRDVLLLIDALQSPLSTPRLTSS